MTGPFYYSRGTMTEPRRSLEDVLLAAQRVGTLGNRPIAEVIEHARQFVDALPSSAHTVIDIGTGGGVPGLVIAVDRPDLTLVLADRRATRMDALARGVAAMGLSHRVQVITADIADLGVDPEHIGKYDVVVCRGFGPPELTATLARPLQKNGGTLIVSEPPIFDPSRWPEELTKRARYSPPEYLLGVVRLTATP